MGSPVKTGSHKATKLTKKEILQIFSGALQGKGGVYEKVFFVFSVSLC